MKTNGYKTTKALRAISEEDALAPGIAEKSEEFVEKSAEVYTKG